MTSGSRLRLSARTVMAVAVVALALGSIDDAALSAGSRQGEPAEGVTTTTLPEGEGDVGRIIPLPDSGRAPESPGDRGGWQQVTLFFVICLVILAMAVYVWRRSRCNRARLGSDGLDRVSRARHHGGDVRGEPHRPG